MKYTARIRRNSDGVVVEHSDEQLPWEDSDASIPEALMFIWGEGNSACDCNRDLFFNRAHLNEPGYWSEDDSPESMCGHSRYSVLSIRLDDGTEIFPDEVRNRLHSP